MKIHYLQHCDSEDLANILPLLKKRGHKVSRTLMHKRGKLPSLDTFDWLIIMGGPMNVDEERLYPWLKAEKAFIKKSIRSGKTILGVCLGAQLISCCLGAKVKKNRYKEIGWHKVKLTQAGKKSVLFRGFPPEFTPIHWHEDTFDIPARAKLLASSAACRNQAFSYAKNVFAVQFHIEYGPKHVMEFYRVEQEPEVKGRFEQGEKQIMSKPALFRKLKALTEKMLLNIEGTIEPS